MKIFSDGAASRAVTPSRVRNFRSGFNVHLVVPPLASSDERNQKLSVQTMRHPAKFIGLVFFNFGLCAASFANPVVRDIDSLPYVLNSEKAGRPTSKIAHKFEEHDFAHTGISLRPDGNVSVETRFENGKSAEADHFYCRIELLDAGEKLVAAARQEAGLNAGRERTVAVKVKLTPQQITLVKKVRLTYGHFDLTEDAMFWKQVREASPTAPASVGDFTVLTR